MYVSEFVEAYPRNVNLATIKQPNPNIDMTRSREWSSRFGIFLHDALREGVSAIPDAGDFVDPYMQWYQTGYQAVARSIRADNSDDSFECSNEVNFHPINASMMSSWLMLLGDYALQNTTRNDLINISQDALAANGLAYAMNRQTVSGIESDYMYFEDVNASRRGSFEGRANEFDAGIVLLEMMKRRKDIIVVPAPIQFEKLGNRTKTSTGKSPNVDFVVVKGDQAVGVQVKSTTTKEAVDKYDNDRVILLDSATDLGNQRILRTKKGSSDVRIVTWGGLISVQRYKAMKLHGRRLGVQTSEREITLRKMRASSLTAGVKPYLEIATQRITQRVDAHFAERAA